MKRLVARNRLRDLSVVGPNGIAHPDTSAWSEAGDTSVFVFRTGAAGTYVVGASTLPRTLRMEAKAFNEYLASDGVTDMLESRNSMAARWPTSSLLREGERHPALGCP